MNKYFLIILISISLIVYTNSATCSTLTTEDTCKAQNDCTWKAATCTGHTSCTNANTSKNTCEAVLYGGYNCTFAAATTDSDGNAVPAKCTGGTACEGVTSPTAQSSCDSASVAGTKCTFTAASCSGKDDENKDDENASFGLKNSALLSLALLLF